MSLVFWNQDNKFHGNLVFAIELNCLTFRWKPEKDGDSLNEYNLHCEEKEIVKISEVVQPFDTEKHSIQTFDTDKLAEERVLVERCAEEENGEVENEENEEMGKDNLGLED